HLTNLVAYGALIYVLCRLFLALGLDAFAVATSLLLFIVHPSHVEVVAWISGRSDLLAALLGCLFLLVLTDRGGPVRTVLAGLALFSALLVKEVAICYALAAFFLVRCKGTS